MMTLKDIIVPIEVDIDTKEIEELLEKVLDASVVKQMDRNILKFLAWHKELPSVLGLFDDRSLRELLNTPLTDTEGGRLLKQIGEEWYNYFRLGALDYLLREQRSLKIAAQNPLGFSTGVALALSVTSPQTPVPHNFAAAISLVSQTNEVLEEFMRSGLSLEEILRSFFVAADDKQKTVRSQFLEQINKRLSKLGAVLEIEKGAERVLPEEVFLNTPSMELKVYPRDFAKGVVGYLYSLHSLTSPYVNKSSVTDPDVLRFEILRRMGDIEGAMENLDIQRYTDLMDYMFSDRSSKTRHFFAALLSAQQRKQLMETLGLNSVVFDVWMAATIPSFLKDLASVAEGKYNTKEALENLNKMLSVIGYRVEETPNGKIKTIDLIEEYKSKLGDEAAEAIEKYRRTVFGHWERTSKPIDIYSTFVQKGEVLRNLVFGTRKRTSKETFIRRSVEHLKALSERFGYVMKDGNLLFSYVFDDDDAMLLSKYGITVAPNDYTPLASVMEQIRKAPPTRTTSPLVMALTKTSLVKSVKQITDVDNPVISLFYTVSSMPNLNLVSDLLYRLGRAEDVDITQAQEAIKGIYRGDSASKIQAYFWCSRRRFVHDAVAKAPPTIAL